MQVKCSECGAEVPAKNVNIDKLVAKCDACGAVFPLSLGAGPAVPPAAPGLAPSATIAAGDVQMPPGVSVTGGDDALVISRSWWHRTQTKFVLLFSLIWNGVVWYLLPAMIAKEKWPLVGMFSVMALIGLGLAYASFAFLVNNTHVRIDRERLSVRHGPMPSPGTVVLRRSDVEFVYADTKDYTERGSDNVRTVSHGYVVVAKTKDGATKTLLAGLPDARQAQFLAQEISRHIG